MRNLRLALLASLAFSAFADAEDKSTAKVTIKGEAWKSRRWDPSTDEAFYEFVRVPDGPLFGADWIHNCVSFTHGQDIGKMEPLKMPVKAVSCIALSTDAKTLYVGSSADWSVWAFPLGRDGMPLKGKRAFDLTMPKGKERLPVTAITTDQDGRLYAATSLGIQVFDRKGKVVEVIPSPAKSEIDTLQWSGKNRDILEVHIDFTVYSQHIKAEGPKQKEISRQNEAVHPK